MSEKMTQMSEFHKSMCIDFWWNRKNFHHFFTIRQMYVLRGYKFGIKNKLQVFKHVLN